MEKNSELSRLEPDSTKDKLPASLEREIRAASIAGSFSHYLCIAPDHLREYSVPGDQPQAEIEALNLLKTKRPLAHLLFSKIKQLVKKDCFDRGL